MSTTQHAALRDTVVGASGVAASATAQITSNDVLTWLSIIYVLGLTVFMFWKWYWLGRRVKEWQRLVKDNPSLPPPRLDGGLDE